MTQQELGYLLKYIKSYYPKWEFNISDSFMLGVWYEAFEEIEFNGMQEILKKYCKSNTFPPQSPTDLLNLIPRAYTPNEAWSKVLDIHSRCKSQEFFLSQVLKEEPSLYPFVKRFNFYDIETDSLGNSCIGYCIGKPFKKDYQEYLDRLTIAFISGELKQQVLENKEKRLLQIEV